MLESAASADATLIRRYRLIFRHARCHVALMPPLRLSIRRRRLFSRERCRHAMLLPLMMLTFIAFRHMRVRMPLRHR